MKGLEMLLYYRIWGQRAESFGFNSVYDAFKRLAKNPSVIADMQEILSWALDTTTVDGRVPDLPFPCPFELHAQYGMREVLAGLGKANLETSGQTGVGIVHVPELKTYAVFITFQKAEKEFSPTTMYADYPISRTKLHWESQSTTAQASATGQNLIRHGERGYTILIFARGTKKRSGVAVPYTYLGPANLQEYSDERPIKILWELVYPMPVEVFDDNRK